MRNYTSATYSVPLWESNLQMIAPKTYVNWDSQSYDVSYYATNSSSTESSIVEQIKVTSVNAEDAQSDPEKKDAWRDITQEPDENDAATQNEEEEVEEIEAETQGKELDARVGGFEENPTVPYGNIAFVEDEPRDLDIGALNTRVIRDNPVDTFLPPLDGVVPEVPEEEEENCIDGEWTFNLAYLGESVFTSGGEDVEINIPTDNPFNPNNEGPAVIYSVSLTFSNAMQDFTFTSNLGENGVNINSIVTTQMVAPGIFSSFITSFATVSIPVTDLPEDFIPTDMYVSFTMDLEIPDTQNSLELYLQNANGANLDVFQLGLQMFDPGPVPFFTSSGFTQFNSTADEGGGVYTFMDNVENVMPSGEIEPGIYQSNPNSFESMLPFVCTPQLPFIPSFPVGIDLDGDGIELITPSESSILFDVNQDGSLEQIAWTSPDDGMLIYDYDQNQLVTKLDEFSLVNHAPSANSDLEALGLAFDSNQDGIFNVNDAEWSKFGVWQDHNTNGVTDEGEFLSLESLGITGISTIASGDLEEVLGSNVLGSSEVQWQNENSGRAYDLALAVAPADHTAIQSQVAVDSGEVQLI